MIVGNRNGETGPIVGVDQAQIGEFFLPWFFREGGGAGSVDVPRVCLCIGKTHEELDPDLVAPTSYEDDVRHSTRYPKAGLMEAIECEGQQVPIEAGMYHFGDPVTTGLIEDPLLLKVHIGEGHNRWVSCMRLGRKLKAHVHHFYVMDAVDAFLPSGMQRHYASTYTESLWSPVVQGEDRLPWFSLESLRDGAGSHKQEAVKACLALAREICGEFALGVDIGCAEGAYSAAMLSCCDRVIGYDWEWGRIFRAWLGVHYHKHTRLSFCRSHWNDIDSNPDLVLLLSVLHHTKDPTELLERFGSAKALVVQVRVCDQYTPINAGSRVGIHALPEYEIMFAKTGRKVRKIETNTPGEAYYLLTA